MINIRTAGKWVTGSFHGRCPWCVQYCFNVLEPTGSLGIADRNPLQDISHVGPHPAKGASDSATVTELAVLGPEDLEEILATVKRQLRVTTQVLLGQNESDPLLNRWAVYRINDNDLHGLVSYIINTAILRLKDTKNSLACATEDKPSDQCPRIPKTMHSVAPVAVGPATTISVPQASFTNFAGATDGASQKIRRGSTTATILSRDSVTEITWMVGQGRLEAAGDPRHSPVGRDISRLSCLSPGLSLDDTIRGPQHEQPPRDGESVAGPATRPEPPIVPQDTAETQQRSSMVVTTNADEDELDQQAEQEAETAERRMSTLARFRKKSVQLGQALGSFINGEYRNIDHRPRRESTVVRLQTALDRIEPARPKPNAAIFGALTGAQPVGPVDHYNARRPGPPINTCSEDGRWHTCVQHEANGCVQFSE